MLNYLGYGLAGCAFIYSAIQVVNYYSAQNIKNEPVDSQINNAGNTESKDIFPVIDDQEKQQLFESKKREILEQSLKQSIYTTILLNKKYGAGKVPPEILKQHGENISRHALDECRETYKQIIGRE
jgi:hypothetical protein